MNRKYPVLWVSSHPNKRVSWLISGPCCYEYDILEIMCIYYCTNRCKTLNLKISDRLPLGVVEMWCYRNMFVTTWMENVTNEGVAEMTEKDNFVESYRRKTNRVGGILDEACMIIYILRFSVRWAVKIAVNGRGFKQITNLRQIIKIVIQIIRDWHRIKRTGGSP